ncbi:MAG: prolipoprotein diacylglyceryl transferase [Oligoflexia bacterium]|nr:prolipoprotein diacylglyceryl transferase [Oligoflexia bacterium]
MHPVLFSMGHTHVASYYVFITLGICAGLYVFYLNMRRSGIDPVVMIDIGLIATFSCYIGARLFHVIFEQPGYYLQHPLAMFEFWKGGYVFYGGILLPLFLIYFYTRKKGLSYLMITDHLATPFFIGTVIGRFACLMQGCCYGKHTALPWGIVFPQNAFGPVPKGTPLHPTQVYMMLSALIIFFIVRYIFKNRKFNGETTYWSFILYGTGRSIVEFFRADFRGDLFTPYLSTSQFISLVLVVISAVMLVKGYSLRKKAGNV